MEGDPHVYTFYWENNSGGHYRLSPEHWDALESHGWEVNRETREANLVNVRLDDAIAIWAKATGLNPSDLGCPCCGHPHQFNEDVI